MSQALSKSAAAPGRSHRDATDDSAGCGAQRDNCRARCRDARSLLRRSRNSSDKNGSSVRASDSPSNGTRESGLSGRRALLHHRSPMPFEAARDRCVIRIARTGARIDDEIHCGQFMLMLAKRFPDEALDAIAAHRIPNDAGGDRQSKTGRGRAGVTSKYREQSVGRAARITIHAIEFGFLPEALRGFEWPSGGQAGDERAGGAVNRAQPLRQLDACDPSRGAGREPDDLLGWPCGRESRECAYGADCSVGRFASCGLSPRKLAGKNCAKTSTWWAERRAARVRSALCSVKHPTVRDRHSTGSRPSVFSRAGAVDNPRANGIDSRSFRVTCAEQFLVCKR